MRETILASDVLLRRFMRNSTSSLLLLLLGSACTGSISGMNGAPGSGMPPPPEDVQITVQDAFVPQANVRVLFQNADGTTISEATTDASGHASADMPDGGNLTVIRTYPVMPPDPPREDQVYTYVGVKPGDRLVLGNATTTATPTAINVIVPTGAQGTVKVVSACGEGQGTAPNVAISVASCPAQLDFYVTDADTSFVAHASYASSVDLSQNTLRQDLTTTLNATNIPANTAVSVEERLMSTTFELFRTGPKRVDQGLASANLPDVDGVDGLAILTSSANNATEQVASRAPYAATPVILDASAGLIPTVSDTSYSPTGVSWAEQGPGSADFVLATLHVTRSGTSPIGATDTYTRTILAPHAGTSLELPLLRDADAIYNPSAADQISGQQAIVAATGGYDAARAGALGVADLLDITPSAGTLTMSYAGGTAPTP